MPLAIDTLPKVNLDPAQLTAVCDPDPSQGNMNAGESKVTCFDGLVLGLRALQTRTDKPFQRVYLRRPPCTATPCTSDELNMAQVTGWTVEGAMSVELDARFMSVTGPVPDPGATWPEAGAFGPVPVKREAIKGAPKEVAARRPYPFCGRAEVGRPPEILACFRAAVLAARPAEMIERVFGTEGGEILWLFRYSGRGALARYEQDGTHWVRQVGTMNLGITPAAWAIEQWSSGVVLQ